MSFPDYFEGPAPWQKTFPDEHKFHNSSSCPDLLNDDLKWLLHLSAGKFIVILRNHKHQKMIISIGKNPAYAYAYKHKHQENNLTKHKHKSWEKPTQA